MQPPTENNEQQALSLKELAGVLVKYYGYHEGLFDASFLLNVAVGTVGPAAEQQFPGAGFSIQGVELARRDNQGPNTVNAAEVNPSTKRRGTARSMAHKAPLKG